MEEMGKRHLTPQEIMAQCKMIARERRMCERTPWTAMGIISGYVLMTSEGFKGQRIKRITDKIADMNEKYNAGEITVEGLQKRLMYKADWSIEHVDYTENDIRAKKGTYHYWIQQKQIDPQNVINREATKYMLFFFTALMEEYSYGKDRLTRVERSLMELLEKYRQDRTSVKQMQKELLDDAGVWYELPIDPLTETSGSVMV